MDSHKSSASAYWTNAINTRLDPLDAAIATKSASERMEVLEKIHSEVRAIEAAVTLAKRRLNAALPVGRLHSEILGLVFEHCALDEPFFIEDERITIPPDRPHGLGWIRVTHVSRRWREVALAHPSLWSIITFSNGTTWAEESVRRCKAAPMFIDISHRYNLSREVLGRILASKMQQVHTLQLMTATRRDLPSSILSHPAPNLRTFRSTMWYFSGASLPSGLFAGQTPSLRTLDIKVSSNVDWNAPILNNLTTLNIQVSPPSATSAFSQSRIQDVLGALRRMPLLETLVLEIPKVQGVGDSLPDTSGVDLPRLEVLELFDMTLAALAVFLRHIHSPPDARINTYCDTHEDTDSLTGLQAIARELQEISHMREMQSLRLDVNASCCPTPGDIDVVHSIGAWREPYIDSLVPGTHVDSRPPNFRLILKCGGAVDGREPLNPIDLCSLLPFHNVRTMRVDWETNGDDSWSTRECVSAFTQYRNIEHIHTVEGDPSRCGSAGLLDALLDDIVDASTGLLPRLGARDQVSASLDAILFPSLKSLWPENSSWTKDEDVSLLAVIAEGRTRIGHPLDVVHVRKGSVTSEWIGKTEKTVRVMEVEKPEEGLWDD